MVPAPRPFLLVANQVLRLEDLAAGVDGGDGDQVGGHGKQRGEEGKAGVGQGDSPRQAKVLPAGQAYPDLHHAQAARTTIRRGPASVPPV